MSKKPRTINVCTYCRVHKIKCDKGKPCSNCIKYNNESCTYPGLNIIKIDKFVSNFEIKKKVDFLKLEIQNLENKINKKKRKQQKSPSKQHLVKQTKARSGADKSKYLNIHQLFNDIQIEDQVRKYSPPLSFQSFIILDNLLNQIHRVGFQNLSLDSKLTFFNQLADSGCEPDLEKMFIAKYHEDEGYEDYKLLNGVYPTPKSALNTIVNVNSIYLKTNSKNDSKFILVSKVHYLLPPPQVIQVLVNRFFRLLYPFIPVLDETDFRINLSRVLMNDNKIVIYDKLDLTYLAMLLVILRLSFLSVLTVVKSTKTVINTENNNDNEIKLICLYPIALAAINVAQEVLQQFDTLMSLQMEVLQLSLLLRSYEILGPEYILGSRSGQSFTVDVVLIMLAQRIGIFNETSFANDSLTLANLKRKIAVFIFCSNSIVIGSLNTEFPLLSLKFGLPEVTIHNCNNRDWEIENLTVKFLKICIETRLYLGFDILNNFEQHMFDKKVEKVDKMVSDLMNHNNYSQTQLPVLYQIINTFTNRYVLTRKIVELSIYFHIFNGNVDTQISLIFLDKCIQLLFTRVFPKIQQVFKIAMEVPAYEIDLLIIPSLLHLVHRGFLVILSFLTRVKVNLLLNEPKREANVVELGELLNHTINLLFQFTFNLSNRYYYAWKIFKELKYYVRCINLLDLKLIFANNEADCVLENSKVNLWLITLKKFTNIQSRNTSLSGTG